MNSNGRESTTSWCRSFHLFAVPEDIVVIAPRFRGFRFFIVEDEIVFVDPVTFEIVAVMPL